MSAPHLLVCIFVPFAVMLAVVVGLRIEAEKKWLGFGEEERRPSSSR